MRVHISELIEGDRLAKEVYNNVGTLTLPAAKKLTEEDIQKLTMHNIDYVDIIHRHIDTVSIPRGSREISAKILPHFNNALSGFKNMFAQAKIDGFIEDEQINDDLNPLLSSLEEERDVVSLLIELSSKDDYTYQHSVQVGMISYFIAKWLGKNEHEAFSIGKAGYLHDVGKSKIASSILQKPAKLTIDEFEEIKKHPILGYNIITESLSDHAVALVALQHHERLDGGGYPYRLSANKIHPNAKIIAIADIYSAMVSSRSYQKKQDFLLVLKELHHLSFSKIDPFITQTFIKNMIPNFIGKKVTLKSGEAGTIVMNNPNDYFNPLIQIDHTFIDLSLDRKHEIDMIYI